MNAKFEKWYIDLISNKLARAHNNPLGMPTDGDMRRAMEMGWQAAIQSLEVTPELSSIAHEAYSVKLVSGAHTAYECWDAALTAVFNAIKE
jgi:hypothetical protein